MDGGVNERKDGQRDIWREKRKRKAERENKWEGGRIEEGVKGKRKDEWVER